MQSLGFNLNLPRRFGKKLLTLLGNAGTSGYTNITAITKKIMITHIHIFISIAISSQRDRSHFGTKTN